MSQAKETSAPKYSRPEGPYLSTAVIAANILTETDSALTIVRIIDTVGVSPDVVNSLNGDMLGMPLFIFVSFRAGGFTGKKRLSIVQEGPSGSAEEIGRGDFQFDGSSGRLFTIKAPLTLNWEGEGQYWYDVLLDDTFCSRISLRMSLGNLPDEETSKT